MKENQIESCQKCSLVKNYEWHKKKSFASWFNKKWPDTVLKIDAYAASC